MRVTTLCTVLIAGTLAFTGTSFAAPGLPNTDGVVDMGERTIDYKTGAPITAPASLLPGTTTSYLCWSGTGTLSSSGSYVQNQSTGLNKLYGDDLHMNTTGKLGNVGFSIVNNSATGSTNGNLSACAGEIDFYRQSDSSFIGGLTWNLDIVAVFGSAFAPQSSGRINFGDGGLESLGITLDTPDVFMTTTFTSQTGLTDPSLIGIQIRTPAGGAAAPGASSTDGMILNGTFAASPFAGAPTANTSYFVRLSPVPEPVSLSALALALPFVARRRKA